MFNRPRAIRALNIDREPSGNSETLDVKVCDPILSPRGEKILKPEVINGHISMNRGAWVFENRRFFGIQGFNEKLSGTM